MLQIIKADFLFYFYIYMSPKQNAYDHLVVVLINGYFNLFCKRAYITRTASEQSK